MPAAKNRTSAQVECCRAPACCDMRGMLSFLIMHLLSKRKMYGMEIAEEIAKRKGDKPNPGTLYPTLKSMEKRGIVTSSKKGNIRYYELTKEGREGLAKARTYFVQAYGDIIIVQRGSV